MIFCILGNPWNLGYADVWNFGSFSELVPAVQVQVQVQVPRAHPHTPELTKKKLLAFFGAEEERRMREALHSVKHRV